MKLKLAAATLATLLLLPITAAACELAECIDDGRRSVRSSFTVRVTLDGTAVSGVNVRVRQADSDARVVFQGMTASDGTVRITNMASGQYSVTTEFAGYVGGGGCLFVKNDASPNAKELIAYNWGEFLEATQQVQGTLSEFKRIEPGTILTDESASLMPPIVNLPLRLVDALSKVTYESTSGDQGQFSFTVPNAVYILMVDGGAGPSGKDYKAVSFLIRVDDSAPRHRIDVWRGNPTSCGELDTLSLRRERN